MQDPSYELAQKEIDVEYITQVVEGIHSLPPCQRKVMICFLKEQLDDVPTLTQAFKKFGVNIEAIGRTSKKKELQNLKASLSTARKKLRSLKPARTELSENQPERQLLRASLSVAQKEVEQNMDTMQPEYALQDVLGSTYVAQHCQEPLGDNQDSSPPDQRAGNLNEDGAKSAAEVEMYIRSCKAGPQLSPNC